MPQLPSGLRVGVDIGLVTHKIEQADFGFNMQLLLALQAPQDIDRLASIVVFEAHPDYPEPGKASRTEFMLNDWQALAQDWSVEDGLAFEAWIASAQCNAWREERYAELHELLARHKRELPENLRRVF